MSETTYYQRNRKTMLKRAKDYYQNRKKVLRYKARNKYRKLSEEDNNIKRESMEEIDILICQKKKNKN